MRCLRQTLAQSNATYRMFTECCGDRPVAEYHGNRLEEFAQLLRSDVRREEDIWFIDINDEGQKQVKNEQSKRRVPIHPELLRLGFIDYVESTAPNPDDHVFPLLRPGGPDNKLGYYFSKWWTRYRKDIGVYMKGVDYHSFRATVATKLAEADVSLEVRNELLGHEGNRRTELPEGVFAEASLRSHQPSFLARTQTVVLCLGCAPRRALEGEMLPHLS